MQKAAVIKQTEAFVKERLDGECTGHDWWHIVRVRNNAKAILKTEKADTFVVDMAVLLHDVGDWKVINKSQDDYTIAEKWLKKCAVPANIAERIMFIIRHMSFNASIGKKLEDPPVEFCIVQDADRLDAIGAIGIARTFAYGGKKDRSLHDPRQKTQKFKTPEEYRNNTSSSFHHFGEKVLRLKGLMNTKAAKRIAARRHAYTEKYLEEFLAEWEGRR
jgi:uncharacterized protein